MGDLKAHPPAGQTVHSESRFSLRICELNPPAGERRGLVIHPGAVVILAFDEAQRIMMIRNHRWQVGQTLLELPAGTCEAGEAPRVTAARELEEEVGVSAAQLRDYHSFFALPGGSTEVMHVFTASELTEVGQRLEPDEDITVVPMSIDDVRRALSEGEIIDGKTIAVLSLFLLFGASPLSRTTHEVSEPGQ